MQKNKKINIVIKILAIIILAMIILITNKTEIKAAYNASNNTITGVIKGDGETGATMTITEGGKYAIGLTSNLYGTPTDLMFLTHKNLYCIMRGYTYEYSTEYICVGIKKLEPEIGAKIGYAVSKQDVAKRTIFLDAVTNLIWTYSDGNATPFAVNGYTNGNKLHTVPLAYKENITMMENGKVFSWNLDSQWLWRVLWMKSDKDESGLRPYWTEGMMSNEVYNTWANLGIQFSTLDIGHMNMQGLKNYFETERIKFERYKLLAELAPEEELPDDIIYSNSETITQNSNGLYGPFKIDYLSAENVPDATGTNNTYMLGKVTMTIGGIEVSPENIVDAAGNKCTIPVKLDEDNGATIQELPKSGEEFYIKADGIENGAELKIKYDYNIYSSAFARFHRNGYDAQDLAYIDYELTPATIEKTFTLQAEETIDIFFKKQGPNGELGVGAQFRVDFENATNIDGNTTMNFTVYTTGTFEIQRIKITNPDQDVKITITELAPPPSSDVTYIPYKTPIVIYLRYDKTIKSWALTGWDKPKYDKDGKELDANVSVIKGGRVIYVTATNDVEETTTPTPPPTSGIAGIVWLDGQRGLKPVEPINGNRDSGERGVSGVRVILYKRYVEAQGRSTSSYSDNIQAQLRVEQQVTSIYTNTNGTFSFGNLPAEENIKAAHDWEDHDKADYQLVPNYNYCYHEHTEDCYDDEYGYLICPHRPGSRCPEEIYYVNTQFACECDDAVGVEYRVEFVYDGINYEATIGNSEVSEVNRGGFNANFQTINNSKGLIYNYSNGQSILDVGYTRGDYVAGGSSLDSEYAITATTDWFEVENSNYFEYGLVRRGVDLATVTDVYSATVSINGESITYNYNDIASLPKDSNGNPIINDLQGTDVTYNLYLYNSDYNYRIGDYKLGAAQSGSLAVNEYGASNALKAQRESDGALQVEVIYQVLLNNQSAAEATINQIAYYYDTHYTLKEVYYDRNGSKTTLYDYPSGTQSINGKNYAKVTVNTSSIAKLTDSDNQTVIYFKFIINDLNGALYLGQRKNWVEITEYYTQEGLIDTDSAPGNISAHPLEDDSDDAATLDVKLNDQEREISGYVFEDDKESDVPGGNNIGNGMHDSDEPMINDVIVQLIEIKDVTIGSKTLRLEYIWQETVSGSNRVRCLRSDGTYDEYEVTNNEGEYTFRGFIPGNYIVRFVYGDDEYWDNPERPTIEYKDPQNVLKYNGQDYKSTVDMYYTETEFENSSYPANASMARDNEARRLEEMAYARSISETDVSQLLIDEKSKDEKSKLEDTWMCAETSLMWLEISDNKDEGDSTDYIKKNANFGLIERPRADLVLEKHITSLTIDAEQDVEAITNFDKYDKAIYNGLMVDLIANNGEGVLSSATHKVLNKRGRWLVQMDPAKVAGGSIRITYGYRIENLGDADYLGPQLVRELNAGKTYEQIANEVKILTSQPGYIPGAYLGIRYYNVNGGRDPGEEESSIPFQVEDYMSTEDGLNLQAANSFAIAVNKQNELVWTYPTRNASEASPIQELEEVTVLQSREIMTLYANEPTYANGDKVTLTLYDDSIDSISGVKEIVYRSYASQLIYPTSGVKTSDTGTLNKNSTLGNLQTVQSYATLASVPISHITPEADEFIAETVEITLDTGGEDKQAPVILIISITTGLAVIVIGIVLIKKFVIK